MLQLKFHFSSKSLAKENVLSLTLLEKTGFLATRPNFKLHTNSMDLDQTAPCLVSVSILLAIEAYKTTADDLGREKQLTPCLLASSADNICKQFGPRSGGNRLKLGVFIKEIFE